MIKASLPTSPRLRRAGRDATFSVPKRAKQLRPADHHGIWVAQREGNLSKGVVPDHLVTFLEGLAKSKRSSLICIGLQVHFLQDKRL